MKLRIIAWIGFVSVLVAGACGCHGKRLEALEESNVALRESLVCSIGQLRERQRDQVAELVALTCAVDALRNKSRFREEVLLNQLNDVRSDVQEIMVCCEETPPKPEPVVVQIEKCSNSLNNPSEIYCKQEMMNAITWYMKMRLLINVHKKVSIDNEVVVEDEKVLQGISDKLLSEKIRYILESCGDSKYGLKSFIGETVERLPGTNEYESFDESLWYDIWCDVEDIVKQCNPKSPRRSLEQLEDIEWHDQ